MPYQTALETIYFAMMEGKLDDTAVPILKEEDFEALQVVFVVCMNIIDITQQHAM